MSNQELIKEIKNCDGCMGIPHTKELLQVFEKLEAENKQLLQRLDPDLDKLFEKIEKLEDHLADKPEIFARAMWNTKEVKRLEAENKGLSKSYSGAVSKFDDCRTALARAVEQLGSDPTDAPEDKDWHEYLIEELDRLLEKHSTNTACQKETDNAKS